jgi:SAM-dependent methyltransferase
MQTGKWLSYGDLAWTEPLLAPPRDYAEENESYVDLIRKHSGIKTETLLHLASGAGGNDFTFKKHFKVTGVDISERMLEISRALNPEVTYVHGDMRSIDLQESFDAVVIPDSIDYMTTLTDLKLAIGTACKHLKPGGVLLIVAKTREEFQENNFCYTGAKDDVEVTVFENDHILGTDRSTYEATIIYLIRRQGELSIHNDRHVLGLFSQSEWRSCFTGAGLEVRQKGLKGIYDRFILGEGQYPMQVYIGVKPA